MMPAIVRRPRSARLAPWLFAALTSGPAVASDWQQEITPYVWASGMEGDVSIGNVQADVDSGFDEILDNLEMGFMGSYRAGRERWAITIDAMYMGLGASASSGRSLAGADIDVDQTSIEAAAGYTVNKHVTLVGGLRYVDLSAEIATSILGGSTNISKGHRWVDPLVGVILGQEVGERWSLSLRTDVGGFGIGSELTWQYVLAARYELTDTVAIIGALRRIDTRYEDRDFLYDVAASGPGLGIAMRF